MAISDQMIRDEILNHEGSLVVRASAGSGKTTIMVNKIKRVLEEINNHKTVTAITFTKKATQEIKDKYNEIGGEKSFLVTTNDSFIEQEIIRPFINDAYGDSIYSGYDLSDFNNDYSNSDFITYDSLLNNLAHNKLLAKYRDNNKNFKFELAFDIVKKSVACQEYLKYRYQMIFIDEYQDSDMYMHQLFIYLYQGLHIDLFIVGDTKQAIYLWRGAQANIFEKISDSIDVKRLTHNFRSHLEIVNYANVIHDSDSSINIPSVLEGCVGICNLNQYNLGDLIMSNYIDLNKEITIIVGKHQEAIDYQRSLKDDYGFEFEYIPRTPIDDNQSKHTQYLKLIAKYHYEAITIFDFVSECGLELSKTQINRLNNSMERLRDLFPLKTGVDFDRGSFNSVLTDISDYLEIQFTQNDIKQLYSTLSNEGNRVAFMSLHSKYKIMTVYSAKGLEFDQVIGFGKDYVLSDLKKRNNHYVLVTRAKEKVIIVNYNGFYKKQIDDIIFSKDMKIDDVYQYFDLN
ncbi:UvrD-helicase domain-containing protein [Streptococcus pluranimalium]